MNDFIEKKNKKFDERFPAWEGAVSVKHFIAQTIRETLELAKGAVPETMAYYYPNSDVLPKEDAPLERVGAVSWNACRAETLKNLDNLITSDKK